MFKLELKPFTKNTWEAYKQAIWDRDPNKVLPNVPTPHSFCVVARDEEWSDELFLTGVLVFRVEDARMVILEHLCTNEEFGLRMRHRGVELLLRSAKAYAAATGMNLAVFTDVRGIIRILRREGFGGKPVVAMFAIPVMSLGRYSEKRRPPRLPPEAVAQLTHDPAEEPDEAPTIPKRRAKRKPKKAVA